MSSQKKYVEILTPNTPEYDHIWKWGFSSNDQVQMTSLGWAKSNMTHVLIKGGRFGHRDRHVEGETVWRHQGESQEDVGM